MLDLGDVRRRFAVRMGSILNYLFDLLHVMDDLWRLCIVAFVVTTAISTSVAIGMWPLWVGLWAVCK